MILNNARITSISTPFGLVVTDKGTIKVDSRHFDYIELMSCFSRAKCDKRRIDAMLTDGYLSDWNWSKTNN